MVRAATGCDLVVHTPAWHGIDSRTKTETDFWRLNVDGTFWALQAARSAGIPRVVLCRRCRGSVITTTTVSPSESVKSCASPNAFTEKIGYRPRRHFGTFLAALADLDGRGIDAVHAMTCPY